MFAAHDRHLALDPRYSDDDSIKEVMLEADGLVTANPHGRHVLLLWTNVICSAEAENDFQFLGRPKRVTRTTSSKFN